jgi:hypothetical protein
LRDFLEEPVKDHASFDATLGVEDEDDFGESGVVEEGFYDGVAVSYVLGRVGEVALDETLEDVEDDAIAEGKGRVS